MRTGWFATVLLVAAVAAPASAEAKANRFGGAHPVAARFGGGYCYIEVPHLHAYAPDWPALYHEAEGQMVFTGDPTPFGYDGPKSTFYGHHPVVGAPGAVYCYLDGPHYHPYQPPETPDYRVEKGVAFFVGNHPQVYYKEKPRRARQIAVEYQPFAAARPVVEVQPPPEYHGDVWITSPSGAVQVQVPAPAPVVVAPPPPHGVVVAPPPPRGVFVAPPAPQVYVAPPAPRVVVAPPAPHVYVAPPAPHVYVAPPAPHVIVAPPRPVVVAPAPRVYVAPPAPHVYVAPPGPRAVVVGAPGPVYIEQGKPHGKWKHDNGKHKGWYK